MSTATARREPALGCSPVVALRLLSMVEDARANVSDEPEQLVLPLEWAWSTAPVVEEPEPDPAERPDPKLWGGRIALAAFEIMLGRRTPGQLARLMDARTLQVLSVHTSRYGIARRTRKPGVVMRPRLSSVRCQQPHPNAAEITAVVHDGERFRAVAMRMSARGNQWYTTAFELG